MKDLVTSSVYGILYVCYKKGTLLLSVYSLYMNQSGTIINQSELIIFPYIMFKSKSDSAGLI